MSTLNPKIHLTDPSFNYVPSAKTDIRETFRRFNSSGGQDNKKPLVSLPLIADGFVLPVEWFEME